MVDLNEEAGSDLLEQLLGSSLGQGQSGSYWNVQSEFVHGILHIQMTMSHSKLK